MEKRLTELINQKNVNSVKPTCDEMENTQQ